MEPKSDKAVFCVVFYSIITSHYIRLTIDLVTVLVNILDINWIFWSDDRNLQLLNKKAVSLLEIPVVVDFIFGSI